MISIEICFCRWEKSSEPPLWTTKTVWLNPDHIVSIEVTREKRRGTDMDKFTEVHTTKTHYKTTEPAHELVSRLEDLRK
jgi:hypothetical protein